MDNYLQWQLNPSKGIDNSKLEDVKSYLDLVLLALEAIADISSEAVVKAAKDLKLDLAIEDRLTSRRCKSSNQTHKTSQVKKDLEVEQARSLVIVICYLANQHQELLRRAVTLLEEATRQNKPPQQTALLGNYHQRFINNNRELTTLNLNIPAESLSRLAWKLLIDLLFYSGKNGHRLLWMAIFEAA